MAHAEYNPQLATLGSEPPSGDRWLHEIKYDGYRIGCVIDKKGARLISRNGKDWTHVFPSIAEAAQKLKTRDAIIDGEVAMVMPDGRTSFAALQQAAAGTASHTPLVYFVFDLLRLDGERLDRLPLEERKARLRGSCRRALPRRSRRRRRDASATPSTSSATANSCSSTPPRSVSKGSSPNAAICPTTPAGRQLAEIEGHPTRSVRDRRHDRSRGYALWVSVHCWLATTMGRAWSLRDVSAPASRTRSHSSCAHASMRSRRQTCPFDPPIVKGTRTPRALGETGAGLRGHLHRVDERQAAAPPGLRATSAKT